MGLFYNLNYQELHPKFEDELPFWVSVLKAVMKVPNSNRMVSKCKEAALEAILPYANKEREDVEQSVRTSASKFGPCAPVPPKIQNTTPSSSTASSSSGACSTAAA
jgi:hypothetical protein